MSSPTPPAHATPDAGQTPRIFVSHSHHDEATALQLAADFGRAGAYVWIDKHDITDGDFLKRINEGLAKCDWLVLVETKDSLTSPAVEMEVNAALNRVLYQQMRGVLRFIAAPRDPRIVQPLWAPLQYYDGTANHATAVADTLAAIRAGDARWAAQPPPPSPLATLSPHDPPPVGEGRVGAARRATHLPPLATQPRTTIPPPVGEGQGRGPPRTPLGSGPASRRDDSAHRR